jgi:hypothetical protein
MQNDPVNTQLLSYLYFIRDIFSVIYLISSIFLWKRNLKIAGHTVRTDQKWPFWKRGVDGFSYFSDFHLFYFLSRIIWFFIRPINLYYVMSLLSSSVCRQCFPHNNLNFSWQNLLNIWHNDLKHRIKVGNDLGYCPLFLS